MKLNKDDLYNLGCLKLAELGVWTDDLCMTSMRWPSDRVRSQKRYLMKLIETLTDINIKEPGLLESMFDESGTAKLNKLKEKYNGPNAATEISNYQKKKQGSKDE